MRFLRCAEVCLGQCVCFLRVRGAGGEGVLWGAAAVGSAHWASRSEAPPWTRIRLLLVGAGVHARLRVGGTPANAP